MKVTKRSSQCRRYHSYANLKLLNGWRTPAAATASLTGFLCPGLDAGPIIARTDSYQSICIRSLCRHAVVQSSPSNKDCWRTPRRLWSTFTTVYELRRGFMTLANINSCVSLRACGRVGSYHSTIRIRVPNCGSIRPNTNSPFGPLFGPVRIRIEYSVQPYKHACSTIND